MSASKFLIVDCRTEAQHKQMNAAEHRTDGVFVAPSTRIPFKSFATPCICTKNSVLMRRALSFSPSPRVPHNESTSSMKIIAGLFLRANSNSVLTSRSDSPWNFDTRSDELTERKHDAPASVATALARKDLPVPYRIITQLSRCDAMQRCTNQQLRVW